MDEELKLHSSVGRELADLLEGHDYMHGAVFKATEVSSAEVRDATGIEMNADDAELPVAYVPVDDETNDVAEDGM